MINHIKKDFDTGNDIAKALQKFEYENTDNWNPILKASTSLDEDVKLTVDRKSELQLKEDYVEAQKLKM